MISRRSVVSIMMVATFSVAGYPALAGSRRGDPVRMFDTDNDGTLDLAEVKKAASALFAKLDRDHDGTLDKRELAGRLNAGGCRPGSRWNADGRRISCRRRTTLQCGKSGQGWDTGCQGTKYRRRKGAAAVAEMIRRRRIMFKAGFVDSVQRTTIM
jgi:EF hand